MSVNERKEERIRNYKKYRKLADGKKTSDYQVSQQLGFNPAVFSDWKSGKSQPKVDKLLKLAEYFGVTVEAFLA